MRVLVGACALFMCLSGVARADTRPTIVETAVQAGCFKTLVAAVQAAGLVETLNGDGPFTVFAPSDQAFAKLPAGTVDVLLQPENRGALQTLLAYHVVPGNVTSAQAAGLRSAKTVNGQRIDIQVDGVRLQIDRATVTTADLKCQNGTIHVIDQVLIPEFKDLVDLARDARLEVLLRALELTGLDDALRGQGPFTVFAPGDDAFVRLVKRLGTDADALLSNNNREAVAQILKRHVVSGRLFLSDLLKAGEVETLSGDRLPVRVVDGKLTVDGVTFVESDIEAKNGVVHLVQDVLTGDRRQNPASSRGPQTATPHSTAGQELIDFAFSRSKHLRSGAQAALFELTARSLMAFGPGAIRLQLLDAVTRAQDLNTHGKLDLFRRELSVARRALQEEARREANNANK